MSEAHYLNEVYPLQDQVLQLFPVQAIAHYRTGGRAFSRFYFYHCFSDDLDFFLNDDPEFKNKTEQAMELIKSGCSAVRVDSLQSGFARILISQPDVSLKLDFVNDVAFHSGSFIQTLLYHKIDNPLNMLSNKITALNRLEAKDVADILFICPNLSVHWPQIIEDAAQKDKWANEVYVLAALKTFDLEK